MDESKWLSNFMLFCRDKAGSHVKFICLSKRVLYLISNVKIPSQHY